MNNETLEFIYLLNKHPELYEKVREILTQN